MKLFDVISFAIGITGGIVLLIGAILGLSGRKKWTPQWINKALLLASLGCLGWGGLGLLNLSLGSRHRMYLSIMQVKIVLGSVSAGILIAVFLSGQFKAERKPSLSDGEAPGPS